MSLVINTSLSYVTCRKAVRRILSLASLPEHEDDNGYTDVIKRENYSRLLREVDLDQF